jgi:uncharacterized protein YbaA (DUF1428 family)
LANRSQLTRWGMQPWRDMSTASFFQSRRETCGRIVRCWGGLAESGANTVHWTIRTAVETIWGTPWGGVPFPKIVKPKKGEMAVFAFIVYGSKAHRDRVNAKVMKDPFMTDPTWKKMRMPFDPKRVSYGGFKVIVDV